MRLAFGLGWGVLGKTRPSDDGEALKTSTQWGHMSAAMLSPRYRKKSQVLTQATAGMSLENVM